MQKSNTRLTVQKQSISKLSFNIFDIIVNGCLSDGGGGGTIIATTPTIPNQFQ